MSTLHATISALAAEFAHELLRALRNASLDEITAETSGGRPSTTRRPAPGGVRKRGRLPRRTEAELHKMVDQIVALVARFPKGINAEGIKAALKLDRTELPRPIAMALATKKIRKRGQKRATTYFKA